MMDDIETKVEEFEGLRSEYVWCGMLERRHHHELCSKLRTEKGRVICGWKDELGGCLFLTKEEKTRREKAERAAKEQEEKEQAQKESEGTDD